MDTPVGTTRKMVERLNAPDAKQLISFLLKTAGILYQKNSGMTNMTLSEAEQEIKKLKELLWLSHGCIGLYGDDGEMQCGACMIDFKRMNASEIEETFRQIGIRKMKAHLDAQAS